MVTSHHHGIDDMMMMMMEEDNASTLEEECPDRALWDGIFWLEACLAFSRSVEWFQLTTLVAGVREEAFRAGIMFANPHHHRRQSYSSTQR